MPRFPKIESPCPYKGNLNDILEGDVCRLCKRGVTDLSAMSEAQRESFYANCSGDVCVSYRVSPNSAILAAMLAAGAGGVLTVPAIAQELPAPEAQAFEFDEVTDWVTVIVGGIRGDHIELTEEPIDVLSVSDMPVIYEDEASPAGSGEDKAN